MSEATRFQEVACNLCGADDAREFFHRPYEQDPLSDTSTFAATTDIFGRYGRIVRCRRCGLVYTNPRPTPASLLEGYEVCTDETYLSESSSRSINAHLSLNTLRRFVRSGKLVEVGASAGYFLNAARADFDVIGLEPSRWACRIAQERFKLEMRTQSFEGLSRFEPESLDVVVMVDVIEHLPDPKQALALAARALKKNGMLYLVTPNIRSMSARICRSYWWGLRPAHIYYFSPETLGSMLSSVGLETAFCASFGRMFSFGYWADRIRHYPGILHRTACAAARLLDIERKFVYINTRDSLELCARKPA
ncbi:MAG: class I SAM-dependent methyltransferase [Elusimicrobiota bacterium]|jgi:SAM-dependent methyltransferase